MDERDEKADPGQGDPPTPQVKSGEPTSPTGEPQGPALERPEELAHRTPPTAVFKEVALAAIAMDEQARQRPIDPDAVVGRAESIGQHGLLQPICVQQLAPGDGDQPRYKLIFGAHRLAAMRQLHPDDPGATISAMVYPSDTPEIEMKMLELVENLQRLELSSAQVDALTTIYAGFCKQAGLVQSARAKQAQTQAERKGARPDAIGSSLSTISEQVTGDLNINADTAADRIKRALQSAEGTGVTVPGGTIETTSGEDLIKAGEAANEAAKQEADKKRQADEDKRKAAKPKRKPKRPPKINGEGKSGKSDGPAKQVLVRYGKQVERACNDARTALDGQEMTELVKWQAKLDDFHRKQIRAALDGLKQGLRKHDKHFKVTHAAGNDP
jgi:ParB-like chromosome segregation protein Spo0J